VEVVVLPAVVEAPYSVEEVAAVAVEVVPYSVVVVHMGFQGILPHSVVAWVDIDSFQGVPVAVVVVVAVVIVAPIEIALVVLVDRDDLLYEDRVVFHEDLGNYFLVEVHGIEDFGYWEDRRHKDFLDHCLVLDKEDILVELVEHHRRKGNNHWRMQDYCSQIRIWISFLQILWLFPKYQHLWMLYFVPQKKLMSPQSLSFSLQPHGSYFQILIHLAMSFQELP